MTDFTVITDQGSQTTPLNPTDFMELDVPLEKINRLQNEMPSNQNIYSGAVEEFLLIFTEDFTPDTMIIDGILGEGFQEYRVDIDFIGL